MLPIRVSYRNYHGGLQMIRCSNTSGLYFASISQNSTSGRQIAYLRQACIKEGFGIEQHQQTKAPISRPRCDAAPTAFEPHARNGCHE